MKHFRSRRRMLATSFGTMFGSTVAMNAMGTLSAQGTSESEPDLTPDPETEPFLYSFNTGTIMGQQLPLPDEVRIVARAGYHGIEPWCRKIHEYVEKGESLDELRKQIDDSGLMVVGAIGFADWANEDPDRSQRGFEEMRRDMDVVARIGGTRIAAPAGGLFNVENPDLRVLAEKFGKICELGREMGVQPCLEPWGASKGFSRLSAVAMVLAECGVTDAMCCLDVFHIYKSGADFAGLGIFSGRSIGNFHINDYPADPPRETATDGDRVMPGEGVAPLSMILRTLHKNGYSGPLSLELFNPKYFAMDAYDVAVMGLAETRRVVRATLQQ